MTFTYNLLVKSFGLNFDRRTVATQVTKNEAQNLSVSSNIIAEKNKLPNSQNSKRIGTHKSKGIDYAVKSSQYSDLTAVGFNKTFICCKESFIESPTSFYGSFYLGPFPESLALTLSHNIRRTLLSELPGLAITAVEIDGVLHKYSNIPGIKETVIDILSNIQNIVLVKTRLANSFIAFLKVRGPGIVKASDIRLPSGVELVNPEQHIATLAEDAVLNIQFWIHESRGSSMKQQPNFADGAEKSFVGAESSVLAAALSKNGPPSFNSFTTEPHNLTQQSWGGSVASMDYSSLADFEPVEPGTATGSNKIYLDAVFMPVTKVNALVETNYKATDDPIKKGPFIFSPDAKAQDKVSDVLFPELEQPNVTKSFSQVKDRDLKIDKTTYTKNLGSGETNLLSQSKRVARPCYFAPLLAADSKPPVSNYLQLRSNFLEDCVINNSQKTEYQLAASHSNLNQSYYTSIAPQLSAAIQKNGETIILPPVTLTKPTKQCHIVLEIWTNGSIHPRQALKECLDFLAKTFISLNNVKMLGSMYKSHITYKQMLQKIN